MPDQQSTSIINTEVTRLIAAGTSSVASEGAKRLAQIEIDRRTNALQDGVSRVLDWQNRLGKLTEDVETYLADGAVATRAFSKRRLDERASFEKVVKEMEEVIGQAVNGDDWTPLYKKLGYQ